MTVHFHVLIIGPEISTFSNAAAGYLRNDGDGDVPWEAGEIGWSNGLGKFPV